MPTEVLEVELLPDEGGVRRHLLAVERCGEAERRRGGEGRCAGEWGAVEVVVEALRRQGGVPQLEARGNKGLNS